MALGEGRLGARGRGQTERGAERQDQLLHVDLSDLVSRRSGRNESLVLCFCSGGGLLGLLLALAGRSLRGRGRRADGHGRGLDDHGDRQQRAAVACGRLRRRQRDDHATTTALGVGVAGLLHAADVGVGLLAQRTLHAARDAVAGRLRGAGRRGGGGTGRGGRAGGLRVGLGVAAAAAHRQGDDAEGEDGEQEDEEAPVPGARLAVVGDLTPGLVVQAADRHAVRIVRIVDVQAELLGHVVTKRSAHVVGEFDLQRELAGVDAVDDRSREAICDAVGEPVEVRRHGLCAREPERPRGGRADGLVVHGNVDLARDGRRRQLVEDELRDGRGRDLDVQVGLQVALDPCGQRVEIDLLRHGDGGDGAQVVRVGALLGDAARGLAAGRAKLQITHRKTSVRVNVPRGHVHGRHPRGAATSDLWNL